MLSPATKRFFWDCSFSDLDVQRHFIYIIERLMETGDLDATKWMLATYSRDKLISVLKSTRSLTAKSARFWALYFNLNPSEVPCTRKSWPPPRPTVLKN